MVKLWAILSHHLRGMGDSAREKLSGGREQRKMLLALVFPNGPRGQHQLCAWVIIMDREALEQINRRVATAGQ